MAKPRSGDRMWPMATAMGKKTQTNIRALGGATETIAGLSPLTGLMR